MNKVIHRVSSTFIALLLICLISIPAFTAPTSAAQGDTVLTTDLVNSDDGKTAGSLDSGSYYLDADVTLDSAGDGKADITIPEGKTVTLDLNGHSITGSGSATVFFVAGKLTVRDSSGKNSGKITGGSGSYSGAQSKDGGAVFIDHGTLTLESGSISGNTATNGGGVFVQYGSFIMNGGVLSGNESTQEGSGGGGAVYVYNEGAFYMYGGTLKNNTSHYQGGAVFSKAGTGFILYDGEITGNDALRGGAVNTNGDFYMYGGKITKNATNYMGGGVRINNGGAFYMYGGVVSENKGSSDNQTDESNGGGVNIGNGGKFYIADGVTISGNTFNGDANNVYLQSSAPRIRLLEPVTSGSVYVTLSTKTGRVTSADGTNCDADVFHADDTSLSVTKKDDGNIYLIKDTENDGDAIGYLDGDTENKVYDLTETINALSSGTHTITIYETVSEIEMSSTAVVPENIDLTINALADETVITIPGGNMFTVADNATLQTKGNLVFDGKVSGESENGVHAFLIRSGGTVVLGEDGNTSAYPKVINCALATGSTATSTGGGITNNGTLTINGGTLTGNTSNNGGAIFNTGTLRINGSAITENTATTGSAVHNYNAAGKVYLSGDLKIDGLYLNKSTIAYLTGELGQDASVRIFRASANIGSVIVKGSGYELTDYDADKFTYTTESFTLTNDGQNQIVIGGGIKITLHANNGTEDVVYQYVRRNVNTSLTENPFSYEGHSFVGWSENENGTADDVITTVKKTAATDVYAIWEEREEDGSYSAELDEDSFIYTGDEIKPDVVVYDKDGTSKLTEGTDYTVAYEDNTDAGTAKAVITINGEDGADPVVIEKEFTIDKDPAAKVYANDTTTTATYDAAAHEVTARVYTSAGKELSGDDVDIYVTYYNDRSYTEQISAPTDSGTYFARVVAISDNITRAYASATLEIINADFDITASGYSGVYDGKAHSITVTTDPDATITYSEDAENYSAEKPSYTKVGTYTVYYKAESANYNTVSGSETVKILPLSVEYEITAGSGGSWSKGSDETLQFTCNGALDKFTGIKIDGEEADADNYTTASGSTILDLKASYLETLSTGRHTIQFLYEDGESDVGSFTITASDDDENTTDTDDNDDTDESNSSSDDSDNNTADTTNTNHSGSSSDSSDDNSGTPATEDNSNDDGGSNTASSAISGTSDTSSSTSGSLENRLDVLATGDPSEILLWTLVMLSGMAILTCLLLYRKKRNSSDK